MWTQRSGQQEVILTPRPETPHRSPAKIRRDEERRLEKRENDIMAQCYNVRDAKKREQEDHTELLRDNERKLVNETAWTDLGLPRNPDSKGVVPWKGERVATVASERLGVEIGMVLLRKRGRRIIYVHPGMIPR
jgi:hypothetical protein